MKKIINAPENYVDEMLEGIYVAHPDLVTYVADDLRCLVTANKKEGKVGIATGGGSGHLPLFLGYVGRGMLDGCCVGDVFQSPSSEQMLAVTKAIDSGAGVLYIYGNYNGDIFNFNMAAEMAEFEEGIRVETVLGADDVASGPLPAEGEKSIRRGVAGIFFVYKCAGAAADRMMSLDDVKRVAEKATASVRTMGVALTPCIVPRVGHPGFSIGDDEMEIGMGIHGETGIRRGKLEPADQIVEEMMEKILADFDEIDGSRVAVLVNGLGATTLDEQYIVTRKIDSILKSRNITVKRYYVGEYATALEMAGVSISVLKLDEELESLLEEPAQTPFFHQGSVSEEGTVKMDVKKAAGTAAEGSDAENTNHGYINPNTDKDDPGQTTDVFDGSITIEKISGDGEKTPLPGAVFVVKNETTDDADNGKYLKYDETADDYSWVTEITDATTYTSGQDGKVAISGLKAGSYRLVETQAPEGYNLLEESACPVVTLAKDEDTTDGDNLVVTQPVENNAGATLPSTGGMGTTIFYVVGAILVIGAGILLVTRRRMASK